MPTCRLLSLILIMFTFGSNIAHTAPSKPKWQTANDIVGAVRKFEHDTTLNVQVTFQPQMGTPHRNCRLYVAETQEARYELSPYGRAIINRRIKLYFKDYNAFVASGSANNPKTAEPISKSHAQAIAKAFMQSHYPSPSRLTTCEISSQPMSGTGPPYRSYTFRYKEHLPGGIYCYNVAHVEVDAILGKVIHYIGVSYPINASLNALITPEQAAQIAINKLKLYEVTFIARPAKEVTRPDDHGIERLCYRMLISGKLNKGDPESYATFNILINAYDGSTVSSEREDML
jgi:hypothetical protein